MSLKVDALEFDSLTADPVSPVDGEMWFRSDLNKFRKRVNGVTYSFGHPPSDRTWTVAPSNPDADFTTIAAALAASSGAGDTILVYPGDYNETITIVNQRVIGVTAPRNGINNTSAVRLVPVLSAGQNAATITGTGSITDICVNASVVASLVGDVAGVDVSGNGAIYSCLVVLSTVGATSGNHSALRLSPGTGSRMIRDSSFQVGLDGGGTERAIHITAASLTVCRFENCHTRKGNASGYTGDVEINNASARVYFFGCVLQGALTVTAAAEVFVDVTTKITGTVIGLPTPLLDGATPNGIVWYDFTAGRLRARIGGATRTLAERQIKAATITSPSASENLTLFYTVRALTIRQVSVVTRGTTPSVTWQIKHATDRSAAGTDLFASSQTTTNTTTGDKLTSFAAATVPANSWVWLVTSALSGTVLAIHHSVEYTEN